MFLQRLYPNPAKMQKLEGFFVFNTELEMETDACLENLEIERLKTLFYQFTCTAANLKLRTTHQDAKTEVNAVLHTGNASLTRVAGIASGGGYRIQISADMIHIVAADNKCLIDAFTTLLQLIEPVELSHGKEKFIIRCVDIEDRGAMPFRGLHLCVFPDTRPIDLKKAIRLAGFLKFTHVILEFWGTYSFKTLPELGWKNRSYSLDTVNELLAEIRSFGMEPIPMLNHVGHASQCRGGRGKHVVLDQAPRYSMLFEPDGWTWCLTNPDTVKLLRDLRSEMMDLFGEGSYFHLGCDEAISLCTCPRCTEAAVDKGIFLAEYINNISRELKTHGRRSIIWHDGFIAAKDWEGKDVIAFGDRWHHTAGGIDYLDKDIIIADWQYYKDFPDGEEPTAAYFAQKGFDVLLSTWNNRENAKCLCNTTKRLGSMGVILTTWQALSLCMNAMPEIAVMMWDDLIREKAPNLPDPESATLLRKLITGTCRFEDVGWFESELGTFEREV